MSSNLDPQTPGSVDCVVSEGAGTPSSRAIRKRQRLHGEKFCQVCGDKALAHHFGALACETCKAFFRRNAATRDQKVCLFKGACTVDMKTRRFCPACRLKKCFDVGMLPDLILDEEEKKERRKHQHTRKKPKAKAKAAEEGVIMAGENISNASCSSQDNERNNEIQSPPCTVTTTFSPEHGVASTLEQERAFSVLEQAWQSASELTAAEISASKSLVSFSSQGSNYGPGHGDPHTSYVFTPGLGSRLGDLRAGEECGDSKAGVFTALEDSRSPDFAPQQVQSSFMSAAADHHTQSGSFLMYQPGSDPLLLPRGTSSSSAYHLVDSTLSYQSLAESPPPLLQANHTLHVTQQHLVSNSPSTHTGTLHSIQVSDLSRSYGIRLFEHVPRDQLPSDPYMYWRLSEEERCLLTQLSATYQDTILSILKGSPPREFIPSHLITPENYLQESEHEARNAVTFAKRMEDFRQLRQDEQIGLLKASTAQVLGVRGCALYVAERDAWLTNRGYFTPDHYRTLLPNYPLIEPCLDYSRVIKSIVKNDVTLYALLHCLVLFDPSDEHIIDRQLINAIRDKYIILLRHYLESVYSYAHSEKYMLALQENLLAYRSMSRDGKPYIKLFFPTIPSKLLLEILDLD